MEGGLYGSGVLVAPRAPMNRFGVGSTGAVFYSFGSSISLLDSEIEYLTVEKFDDAKDLE